jgi:hypothetical protein
MASSMLGYSRTIFLSVKNIVVSSLCCLSKIWKDSSRFSLTTPKFRTKSKECLFRCPEKRLGPSFSE